MKKLKIILLILILVISLPLAGLALWVRSALDIEVPVSKEQAQIPLPQVEALSDSLFICGESWLKLETGGISELYLEGSPYEIGLKNGALTASLTYQQEEAFVDFFQEIVPTKDLLYKLKYFIVLFNSKIDKYVPSEYLQEIYGISRYASHDFDQVLPPYHRILNYHASHDVGHVIDNLQLGKCTSFSVKNDSLFLSGRNFDFTLGEAFARNKIVAFYRPEKGSAFMMVTWGGLIGVVSGMNEHGLSITLNSAKSGIPLSAKNPVTLVAREVLQYASNIDEAYAIIAKRELFVSEMFMINSAADDEVAVIERSLNEIVLLRENKEKTLMTNHFVSEDLHDDPYNLECIEEGVSTYRYQRLQELLATHSIDSPEDVAAVLRDRKGLGEANIGLGNEKVVNQLIAHHGVIFSPRERKVWVSTFPYQIGEFKAYDLNVIFNKSFNVRTDHVCLPSLRIPADTTLTTEDLARLHAFRRQVKEIDTAISLHDTTFLNQLDTAAFRTLNPFYYETYYSLGKLSEHEADDTSAVYYYKRALSMEVSGNSQRNKIEERLAAIYARREL